MKSKGKAYYLLVSFFYIFCHSIAGQDQKVADSLAKIYKADTARGVAKMELLRKLAFNEARDLKLGLGYAEELIALSTAQGNFLYLHRGYFQKGNIKRLMGDLDEALAALIKSIEAAHKANYAKGEGNGYGAVADIYAVSNNHPNARLYYTKAITSLRQAGDSISLASAISNSGDEFLNNHIYDSALLCFREAEKIFAGINYEIGKAYCQGNIGMVYANIGENELAEKNINDFQQLMIDNSLAAFISPIGKLKSIQQKKIIEIIS